MSLHVQEHIKKLFLVVTSTEWGQRIRRKRKNFLAYWYLPKQFKLLSWVGTKFRNFFVCLFVCLFWLWHVAWRILPPRPGKEATAPVLEGEVFTPGVPGKSPQCLRPCVTHYLYILTLPASSSVYVFILKWNILTIWSLLRRISSQRDRCVWTCWTRWRISTSIIRGICYWWKH